MTSPTSSSVFCIGIRNNTLERLREIRESNGEKQPYCKGCFDVCAPLGFEGEAELWERERDSFKEGNFCNGAGYGVASRFQRVAGAAVTIPMGAVAAGVSLICSAVAFLFAGCCAPCACCINEMEKPVSDLGKSGCIQLGGTALVVGQIAKTAICLPVNIVAPEAIDAMGYQQLNLTMAEASHTLICKQLEMKKS